MHTSKTSYVFFFGALLISALTVTLSGCNPPIKEYQATKQRLETQQLVSQWPTSKSIVKADPAIEKKISEILAKMTLQQKVAQMIQADIGAATPEEMSQYVLGSVLNGGGQYPSDDRYAQISDWVNLAEALYQASMNPKNNQVAIPTLWGTDAVHGHGNVVGATLFPHNIALGAARNPELVKQIAAATAEEVAVTGIDWNFSPTVAVARDDRWGRAYESYGEIPELVAQLTKAYVEGLQGTPKENNFFAANKVLSSAKHFIGDGGTDLGDDRGNTLGDEAELIRTHLPGYISAINAGVQSIMASYSWWDGEHSHTNKRLLTDLLKDHLGFDGFVVSDWQAIGIPHGCRIDSCARAVNAGVDLFMIPNAPDWKRFLNNTVAQVEDGIIPISRIDDAVARILRVKLRMNLWKNPSPINRQLANKREKLGSKEHRNLARQAVRQSLVLLKNNGVLPLNPKSTVLIDGPGADNLAMQSGGWSVTWQGRNTTNSDYPGATSIYEAFKQEFENQGGKVLLGDDKGQNPDTAIVVFGEQPYAEMQGDIENLDTLEVEQRQKEGLNLIKKYKAQNIPVVAILLSGRPLWVNKELNAADAFVAAWQPGTEGSGVSDVLVGDIKGTARFDFSGKLSMSWPATPCQAQNNLGDKNYNPLFPYGFGLNYEVKSQAWALLPETSAPWKYGCIFADQKPAERKLELTPSEGWDFYIEKKTLERQKVNAETKFGRVTATKLEDQDAYTAQWDETGEETRLTMRNGRFDNNILDIYANEGAVLFDTYLESPVKGDVNAIILSGSGTRGDIRLKDTLESLPLKQWRTVSVALNCYDKNNADLSKLEVPFSLISYAPIKLRVKNVRFVPNAANNANIQCRL